MHAALIVAYMCPLHSPFGAHSSIGCICVAFAFLRSQELSALWYSYLYAMPPPPARGMPVPRSWGGLARGTYLAPMQPPDGAPAAVDALNPPLPHAIATGATAPAALLALGREVYCVAAMEVLLEREVENPVESKLALGTNKNARGTASDRLRKQLARLCSAPVRTAQMVALLPQLERDTGDPAVAARVPECVYGVLGTVMLEGGLKHARAVARSLIEIAESVQSA